jgi:hypothetical protein
MPRCKKCGKDYLQGIKEFCTQTCYEADIQKRIVDATLNDLSHTKQISKDE